MTRGELEAALLFVLRTQECPHTVKELCEIVGASQSSVYRWIKLWEREGTVRRMGSAYSGGDCWALTE